MFTIIVFCFTKGVLGQQPQDGLWGIDRLVRAATIAGDTLYVGGDFRYLGPPTGQLAVLDRISGEPDMTWPKIGGEVYAVEPDGAGGFFVAGDFRYAGNEERGRLVHILPDQTINLDFTPIIELDPPTGGQGQAVVEAVYKYDATLFIAGIFNSIDGVHRQNIAAIDLATNYIKPISLQFGAHNDRVTNIVVRDDVMYIAGYFSEINGVPRKNIAALSTIDGAPLDWNVSVSGGAGWVQHIALGDSTLYFSGNFTAVNGVQRDFRAEVTLANQDGIGGDLTAWNPSHVSGSLLAFAVGPEHIYTFGRPAQGQDGWLLRYDRNTAESELFGSLPRFVSAQAIALQETDSQLVIWMAGERRRATDQAPELFLGGFDASTGTQLLDILGGRPANPNNAPRTIVVNDNDIIVGGGFVSFGGEGRRFLAGIDLTTGRAVEFDPRPFSSVEYMTASPDGRFLYWITYNGIGVSDLHTGESWTYWQPSNAAEREAFRASLETAEDGAVNREGPLFADGDRPYVPPALEGAPPRAEVPRVRGGQRYMLATDDRLFVPGWAFDRLSAELVWQTPITVVAGRPLGEVVLFGEGGPGGAGDTLIVSGDIVSAGSPSVTRHDLVALDAETGAVLDWYPGPTYNTAGVYGITLVDDTLYVGGAQLWEIGGHQRYNMAAIDVHTAQILPWSPDVRGPHHINPAIWTADHCDGVIYIGGSFHEVNGTLQLRAAALDPQTGESFDWNPHFQHYSGDGFPGVRTIIVSPEHERVYLMGSFMNSAKGAGHANVVGLSLVGAEPPVGTEPGALPETVSLSAPFPNPARNSAQLTLTLPEGAAVEVALYDVLGRRVAVVHEGALEAGEHALTVDASGLASGLYVVRAAGEGFLESKRITVVR